MNITTNLSRAERAILWIQLELLKIFEPERERHINVKQEILEKGFEIFYGDVIEHIDNEPVLVQDGELVIEVLKLYEALGDFAKKNPKSPFERQPYFYFAGFDGNTEQGLLQLVRYIFKSKSGFDSARALMDKHNGDSHCPNKAIYSKMVSVWTERLEKKFDLDADDVKRILDVVI